MTFPIDVRPDYDIKVLREQVDICRLVSPYVALKSHDGGRYYTGRCPFHNDQKPSFTVYPRTQAGMHNDYYLCQACGEKGDSITFLERKLGLNTADAVKHLANLLGVGGRMQAKSVPSLVQPILKPVSSQPLAWHYPVKGPNGELTHLTALYDYLDEERNLLYQAGRFNYFNQQKQQPDKTFSQRRPAGDGTWIGKLENVRRVLYRLPDLLATDKNQPIFIVEGEKDVDRLWAEGIPATCNVGGAGSWKEEYSQSLTGCNLVIIPDNDNPGRDHARKVSDSVSKVAASVRILELSGLPLKGDVSYWLDAGHTAQELLQLLEMVPIETSPSAKSKPKTISARELANKVYKPLEYIVPGILPVGTTLLAAKPKIGKSWMIMNIATAVAAGGVALSRPVKKANALYLALEDNEARLKRRLDKVCRGVIPEGLNFATEWKRSDQGGMEDLEDWLQEHPETKFVAIDTLKKWRRPASGRENLYNADYDALDGLTKLAGRYNVSIVVVHHTRKGASDDPLDEVSGSNGLTGAVDNALVLRRNRGEMDAVMSIIGRDIEDDAPLALTFDSESATWNVTGPAIDFNGPTSEARQKIIDVLLRHDDGLKPGEISRELGGTTEKEQNNIRQRCYQMLKAGEIVQLGNGKYVLNLKSINNGNNSRNTNNTNNGNNDCETSNYRYSLKGDNTSNNAPLPDQQPLF